MFRVIALTLLLIASLAAVTSLNQGRIIGGRDVSISKHPHQVSLRRKTCEMCSFIHRCGGVILSQRTIITAGHCVYKREATSFAIIAGTDNRSGSDGVIALVDKIVVHQDYNPALTANDVALIFLSTPLTLNENTVWPAKLASEQPPPGAMAVVSGWGATSEFGPNSYKLQEVDVNIIDQDVCNRAYGFDRITSDMLCAGASGGGRDACQNDSGGPLMSDEQLVGIVSWGSGCARPEYPGVYANVANLKSWIDKTLEQNSKFHKN